MTSWKHLDRALVQRALGAPNEPEPPAEMRRAAVLVLLAQTDPGVALLLIRRAERANDPWSGHMALPGGHREPEDADLLATVTRETREEVGFDLERASEYLGVLGEFTPRMGSNVSVRPFVFAVDAPPALTPNVEVDRAIWVPVADLASERYKSEHVLAIEGRTFRFPAFRIGEHTVWGLTYRVVTTLLARVAEAATGPL